MRARILGILTLCVTFLVPPSNAADGLVGVIRNWTAPAFWSPPSSGLLSAARLDAGGVATRETASLTSPLPFVAVTPCRIIDTRGNGFSAQAGPPSLSANNPRQFNVSGVISGVPAQCGIPGTAAAVSLNVAVTSLSANGNLVVYPTGTAPPVVSTLNWTPAEVAIANAAVVALGTGGSISVEVNGPSQAVDLVVDVNGYYGGSIVTSLTAGSGLTGGGTGDVTLSIAPLGITAAHLAANAVTSGAIAPNQVVKSLNGLRDDVSVTGSGAISVSTVGNTINVSSSFSGLPPGVMVLGFPGDAALIAAGFVELGPSTQDGWKPTSIVNAPSGVYGHTAVWTGSRMIVWGGVDFLDPGVLTTNGGGIYDPVSDSWTSTTTSGAPGGRELHTAVWTGSRMIIWGGDAGGAGVGNTGGLYDPVSNSWTPTSTVNAPSARRSHSAVWTGSRMIVWGGYANGTSTPLNTGGSYDPATDTWTPLSLTNAPSARADHTAVWTDQKMIVWGGGPGASPENTGAQYDPVADSWTSTTLTNAPSARTFHRAVWSGAWMIVWGGTGPSFSLNTGSRYDPFADQWTPMTTVGAPSPRTSFTAVWAGDRMIVWDGGSNSGGRYDPFADTWAPTTLAGAPSGRIETSAVWTGTSMIVWGGYGSPAVFLRTGGQYAQLSLYRKN